MRTAVIILAGGYGTRLWPLSRKSYPKQLITLLNNKSLIKHAYDRLSAVYPSSDIFISTATNLYERIKDELPFVSLENFILEPVKKDRSAALGLASLKVKSLGYETIILVNCDEYINNIAEFLRVLKVSEKTIIEYPDKLLVIGMKPMYPSKSFGYIEVGNLFRKINKDYIFEALSFKEKPDKETADYFYQSGKYLWNSAWYVFNPDYIINIFLKYLPEMLEVLNKALLMDAFSEEYRNLYSKCESCPFETKVLEHNLSNVIVLPANVGWSDLGSWKAMHKLFTDGKELQNVMFGNVIANNTEGAMVYSSNNKKLVAVLGLKDVVVIDTDDVLLVSNKENSKELKEIIDGIPENFK